MAKAVTTYQIVLSTAGKTVVLPMTSERKTRSVLVKAVMACRDLIVANLPEADLAADTTYSAGALCFGASLVHFRAA